ncbi:hypothetical protein N658DRAFT_63243 [Parathielavia hyrcaniae]|uniref:Uncharacterized protein n=1 Tax=Parathielavia hyrcaniae TaxID=113614 RepID=A0AAN6Q5S1_9PEZI|nr:hypothetical protein N658DRAFT_63243 [Parathielavia hyrcaniae]
MATMAWRGFGGQGGAFDARKRFRSQGGFSCVGRFFFTYSTGTLGRRIGKVMVLTSCLFQSSASVKGVTKWKPVSPGRSATWGVVYLLDAIPKGACCRVTVMCGWGWLVWRFSALVDLARERPMVVAFLIFRFAMVCLSKRGHAGEVGWKSNESVRRD